MRFRPDGGEAMGGQVDRIRGRESGFATRVVAVKTAQYVQAVGDAEGIGELAQRARRLAAFHQVTVVAQQAQEARILAFYMSAVVHGEPQQSAAAQEAAQRGVGVDRAEREEGEIGIEHVEPLRGPSQHRAPLRFAVAPGVETDGQRLVHGHPAQPSSIQPSWYQV